MAKEDSKIVLAVRGASTRGSISADSRILKLESNPGFSIGDQIIVEIGGEEGRGRRGTTGVGGTWPDRSYPRVEALQADTLQLLNSYAWVEQTGDVFKFTADGWVQVHAKSYYTAKSIPKSLVARVASVDGLNVTLDRPARAATQNAMVYFDNSPALDRVTTTKLTSSLLSLPAGSFAVSSPWHINKQNDVVITGEGRERSTVFSPKGTPSGKISLSGCTNVTVRNLGLQGNAGVNGFGLNLPNDLTEPRGEVYPSGVRFDGSKDCSAVDLNVRDVFQLGVGASFCENVWAVRCSVKLNEPLQQYIQWQILWSDCRGGGARDCSVDSAWLAAGLEMFRSDGVQFIRPRLHNATISCNGAGRFLIDAASVTLDPLSQYSEMSFSKHNPIVNVSSAIQPPSRSVADGGIIRNPVIRQNGYINRDGDLLRGIIVNANNPNIVIEGGYPAHPEAGGLIVSPDQGATEVGGAAIQSDRAVVKISGIRVVGGKPRSVGANIKVPAGSIVENCVADVVEGGVQQDNLSNRQWEATHSSAPLR